MNSVEQKDEAVMEIRHNSDVKLNIHYAAVFYMNLLNHPTVIRLSLKLLSYSVPVFSWKHIILTLNSKNFLNPVLCLAGEAHFIH